MYALNNPQLYIDPSGMSAVGSIMQSASNLAREASTADGPLPYGDMVGFVVLALAGFYEAGNSLIKLLFPPKPSKTDTAILKQSIKEKLLIQKPTVSITQSNNTYCSISHNTDSDDNVDAQDEPTIEYPGDNPSKAPGEEWEWRGKGSPESGEGSWFNPNIGESLHPDLNHGEPIGPHWDYKGPTGKSYRYMPDGSLIPK